MNTSEMAQRIARQKKLIAAEKYDLFYRDFDDKIELIGYIPDPTYDMKQFEGREMLFPKRWVTIDVLNYNTPIPS
jgi:hypothetical protein